MKKLCFAMCLALVMLFVTPAMAEGIMLPDPGYYFGREYKDDVIEFDAYPKAEYDAYTTLLTDDYGLEIINESKGEYGEYCIMQMPGSDDSRVIVTCYGPSPNSDGYGIMFFFGGHELQEVDVYGYRPEAPAGEVAWDDGRMIADPGDYLGYEIECFEIADDTGSSTRGYMKYRYRAIPVEDILAFADAVNASPYFESSGDLNNDVYWLLYFDYTGNDPEINALCAEGREVIGDYFRRGDLSIYIHDPYAEESEFDIYEYPGFTVNSDLSANANNYTAPYEGAERCIFCNGGSCKDCGGSGYVYQWIPGEDDQRRVNCTGCMNGRCTFCDGDGWK